MIPVFEGAGSTVVLLWGAKVVGGAVAFGCTLELFCGAKVVGC